MKCTLRPTLLALCAALALAVADVSSARACIDDGFEDNDTPAQAVTLADGTYDLALCAATVEDEDWFAASLGAGERLVVRGRTVEPRSLSLVVYDTSGRKLGDASLGPHRFEEVTWQATDATDVLVAIYAGALWYIPMDVAYTLDLRTGIACFRHGDCADGEVCRDNTCGPGCRGESDCPVGHLCEENACVEGCRLDSHCAEGALCVDGQCVVGGCRSAGDCAFGERCVVGRCVVPECQLHADCAVGEACLDSLCRDAACATDADCEAFALACEPALGRCVECAEAGDCPDPALFTCEERVCRLQCEEDAYEPNDHRGIPADLRDEVHIEGLRLCGRSAADWYRVELRPERRYDIRLSFEHATGDIDVTLQDADEPDHLTVALAHSDTDGEELSHVVHADDAGTYLLDVALTDPLAHAQTYDLQITSEAFECSDHPGCAVGHVCEEGFCRESSCSTDTSCSRYGYGWVCDVEAGHCVECVQDRDCRTNERCVANRCDDTCEDDEFEENDTQSEATALPGSGTWHLGICEPDGTVDDDWFRVELAPGQTVGAALEVPARWVHTRLELYDGTGQVADGVEDTETRTSLLYTAAEGGSYDLRVATWPDSQANSTPYLLTVLLRAECRDDGGCPAVRRCVDFLCVLPECDASAQCAAGAVCRDHACVALTCARDADCEEDGFVCDPASARCVDCRTDADCAGARECHGGLCLFDCVDDDDCGDAGPCAAGLCDGVRYPDAGRTDPSYVTDVTNADPPGDDDGRSTASDVDGGGGASTGGGCSAGLDPHAPGGAPLLALLLLALVAVPAGRLCRAARHALCLALAASVVVAGAGCAASGAAGAEGDDASGAVAGDGGDDAPSWPSGVPALQDVGWRFPCDGRAVVWVGGYGVCGGRAPCYTALQDAVDAAADGGFVVVLPGTYRPPPRGDRVIFAANRRLCILAAEGPEHTVLDGGGVGTVVEIVDSTVWLQGFAIRGAGPGTSLGADGHAVTVGGWKNLGAAIVGNDIRDNWSRGALDFSTSVVSVDVEILVANNVIRDNHVEQAGVYVDIPATWDGDSGLIRLQNNLIVGNRAPGVKTHQHCVSGGFAPIALEVVNNTVSGNDGGLVLPFCGGHVWNNVVFDNGTEFDRRVDGMTVAHNLFGDGAYMGEDGNFRADPRFVAPDAGDYRLRAESPALGRGTPEGAPRRDFDGTPRSIDRVDVGAFQHAGPPAEPSVFRCGDGHLDAGEIETEAGTWLAFEVCDDGNQENGDGCSDDCLREPSALAAHRVGGGRLGVCAVRSDGSLVCTGGNDLQPVPPSGVFRSIAVGEDHACALRDDGGITCWGMPSVRPALLAPPDGEYLAVSAARRQTCAIRADGTLVCWGDRHFPPPDGRFVGLDLAGEGGCAVREADGGVTCWALSSSREPPPGPFLEVMANPTRVCALRPDGSTACWSERPESPLPPLGAFVRTDFNSAEFCGLRPDGRLVCARATGDRLPADAFVDFALDDGACGLTTEDEIVCW